MKKHIIKLARRVIHELQDSYNEILEDSEVASLIEAESAEKNKKDIPDAVYFEELMALQIELVKLQRWLVTHEQRAVVLFEGRDAAGKGGAIKRITQRLNPRVVRVAALPAPTEREQSQWYFQRYVSYLPAAGEMTLFDRSWYNRAGVERVMDFCTEEQLQTFFSSVELFEKMLIADGIKLIKFWFSVSREEQEARFLARIHDPLKQWKLSPMDLKSRTHWEEYTLAKEEMFEKTHFSFSPWTIIPADNKRKARLNCIAHLLEQFNYTDIPVKRITLPPVRSSKADRKHASDESMLVQDRYKHVKSQDFLTPHE